jgi:hypothetical protein
MIVINVVIIPDWLNGFLHLTGTIVGYLLNIVIIQLNLADQGWVLTFIIAAFFGAGNKAY